MTLDDGDSVEVQGSSSRYKLSRQGDVYMCSCPAWKNQGATVDRRTCKHLRGYLGDDVEMSRVGSVAGAPRSSSAKSSSVSSADRKDTAPPVILAHKWETHNDPTGWWMSEKLDGIRAYWDGESFVSRLGNRFFAPDWFVEALPADTLDGELWVARKMFQKTTSIVRSGSSGEEWKKVTFVIFDAPNASGGFEDRIAHAKQVMTKADAPHARCLEHIQCEGFAHLKAELARVESLGGEGLMLRRPKSAYEVGRSMALLKVKTFHDTEARVVAHAAGAGRHKGRLGALVCELPNGTQFNVGTGFSDDERESPPGIGAIITFRYQELSDGGVPRFPSYVGERIDAAFASAPAKPPLTLKAAPVREKAVVTDVVDSTLPPTNEEFKAKLGDASFVCKLVHPTEGKFWEIEVRGTHHITRFGKVGSTGQMRLTEIGSVTACQSDAEKRAVAKRRAGYQ
jgi:DNA ligase 1